MNRRSALVALGAMPLKDLLLVCLISVKAAYIGWATYRIWGLESQAELRAKQRAVWGRAW